jgi:hypothetical protein
MIRLRRNEPASLGDAFAGFSRNFWHLVGVGVILLISMVCCIVPAAICFGVAFAASSNDPSVAMLAVGGLLGFIGLLAMTYLGVSWIFSFALVIDKRIECWDAMKLSRRVVGMHWWQVFGVLFVTGLLISGVMIAGVVIFAIIVGIATAAKASPGATVAILILPILVLVCLILTVMPLNYATMATAYEDIFGPRDGR